MANARARQLRKVMTRQEVKLWIHLRAWRSKGFHFRRQSPRNGYIVDFIWLKSQLIVEVDGGQHNFDAHAMGDRKRDSVFSAQGFKILRFWNSDIDQNLEGVLATIDRELRLTSPTRPASPATLPRRGRDGRYP